MKCHEAASLQLFIDDELDAGQRANFLAHLDGCRLCARESASLGELRTRLHAQVPYHAMPAQLRRRLDATVARHAAGEAERQPARTDMPARRSRPDARWRWAASGALAGAALTIGATVAVLLAGTWMSNRGLVDAVVAAHGRSSLTGHVVDINSSDHHTVKPWLSQRLDYSPPVVDLKDQGFLLLGGRLDRIDDASIATLVYRSGQHRIDVFVRPLPGTARGFDPASVRGYNIVEARGMGMQWIGVSDVNATQLRRLVNLLAHPPPITDSTEPSAPR